MKRRGFTLVELLAVIVILAIIALIAVPIFLGMINKSKKSSDKEAVNLYTDTVEKAIQKKQMADPNFQPDKCTIKTDGNLECFNGTTSLGTVKVNMKGTKPTAGTIIIAEDDIDYKNIVLNDKTYYVVATLVEDAAPTGLSVGDKYTYRVNRTDTFNFYVLSIEGTGTNQKVNLIMNSNICNDGTISTSENPCLYAWHWQTQEWDEDDNNYGPDTAMTNLYNATKDWTNVPNMIMEYVDENNSGTNNGYTGITTDTNTKETTITGKQNKTSTSQTFGTSSEPLKARLPREDEVTSQDAGCHVWSSNADDGTCSAWLVENLYYDSNFSSYCSTCSTKYSINNNNGITNIYAYWLLSSSPGSSSGARIVSFSGVVGRTDTSDASGRGLRAVITVSKSDLSN